jgi:predicted GIY-YIG superfamily endonuclease
MINDHKYFVYVLQSLKNSKETYVGKTSDVSRRLSEHNAGKNISTRAFRPWKLLSYTAFNSKEKADEFERYLKTGSGRAFRSRHFQ